MSHGNGGVGTQGNLALIGILIQGQLSVGRVSARLVLSLVLSLVLRLILRLVLALFAYRFTHSGLGGGNGLLKALVGLLEEGHVVVERLHIEGTIQVEVAIAVDGITQRGAIVALCTANPSIASRIRGIAVDPIEDGQLIERQLIRSGNLLLVVERRTKVLNTCPDGVFPSGIAIGIEILVHRTIGLLNLGMGGRSEVEVQVLGEVPTQGEVTIPEELLVEDQGQVLVLDTLQIALLQFTIVA